MRNLNKMRCRFIIRWDPKEKRSSCSNKANKGNAQTGNRKHRFDSRILVKGKEIRMGLRNKQTKQIFSFKPSEAEWEWVNRSG